MIKQKVSFIKLGGSLITDKTKPLTVKREQISKIVKDFQVVLRNKPKTAFILGNGAGSFGHYAATITNYKTPYGFAFVQQKVKELNSIIIDELMKHKIPAVSVPFSSVSISKNNSLDEVFISSIKGFIQEGIVPVVYGDVIFDSVNHATIFSTETIFTILVKEMGKLFDISTIVHLTTVPGFLNEDQKVIPHVTAKNFGRIKNNFSKIKGYDVTGGMLHKIEESLKLARRGIETRIVDGHIEGILKRVLVNNERLGTLISSK